MAEHDAEGRIDVERLCLVVVNGGTGGGIAHVRDARVAPQCAHVAGAEHVTHQAVALVHMESVAIKGGNAGCILAAMLQHQQAVIQNLVGR